MAIRISRNDAGNCINFIGSSAPAYWNACLSAELNSDDTDRINIINDIRTASEPVIQYEFFAVRYDEFISKEGDAFAGPQACVDYINANANVAQNTGRFVLSTTDSIDFSTDSTETTVLLDNGDAYAVNSIRAAASDDGNIDILKHNVDVVIYGGLHLANTSIDGLPVTQVLASAVNELNALFQQSGGSTGAAPAITSSTTVNLSEGDTLNYELTATDGVGYEWSGLPSGVVTVEGNVRKLVGGSALSTGTYTITAKAVNYFGEDTQTINLVVSSPPFSNTKSIKLLSNDYLGANAALLDGALGRTGNGSGASEAWTIGFWFKGSTSTRGQTIFYYGSNDVNNGGNIELRYVGSNDQLRLKYGSGYNYLQLTSPANSLPANTWKHVLVTYDGGTTGSGSGSLSNYYNRFTIYIDGVPQTTNNSHSNYGWSSSISGQNLRVGRYASGNYLQGALVEELAVWDSDETSNVTSIYNGGSTHDLTDLTSSPAHYWRMGDGDTYPTIQDNVGNAHFVMYNMTASDIVTDAP